MSFIKDTAYRALDTVTGGRGVARTIGGENVRFPARFSRYYESDYEPETFAFFRRHLKPGDTVLDIGGHIGLFAVVAGKLVGTAGKVYTFEPTPGTRSVMTQVVELNGVAEQVEIRGEAVSAASGDAIFFDTGNEVSNANSLVKTARSTTEIPVKLISVDEFAAERKLDVACVKIDVEGAELDVLRGAKKVIGGGRCAVRLGLHPPAIASNGQSLSGIWDIIGEYGRSVVFDGAKVDREWFCSQDNLFDVELLPID